MTQKEANILIEIITKVVRKELTTFKKQFLSEINSLDTPKKVTEPVRKQGTSLKEVQKSFRSQYHVQRPAKRISNDPVLNALLMETPSIEETESAMNVEEMDFNLPTGMSGRPMASAGNASHVLEAMNRDYSGMFAPKGENKPTKPAIEKNQLRTNYMAMMQEDYIPEVPVQRNNNVSPLSGFPSVEPFSGDEEDLSWLNEVQ